MQQVEERHVLLQSLDVEMEIVEVRQEISQAVFRDDRLLVASFFGEHDVYVSLEVRQVHRRMVSVGRRFCTVFGGGLGAWSREHGHFIVKDTMGLLF